MLCEHNIDLGLEIGGGRAAPLGAGLASAWKRRATGALAQARQRLAGARLGARFEFPMMPADGGCIVPHTDTTTKVISLVLPILRVGEWNPDHGGGTAIVRPRDITRSFNYVNRYMGFDEVETLATLPFEPNQSCQVDQGLLAGLLRPPRLKP